MARSYANRHASIDKSRTSTGMRRTTVTKAGGRRTGSRSSLGSTMDGSGLKSAVRRAPRKMGPVRQGGHPGD